MIGKKSLLISAVLLFSILFTNLALAQTGLVSHWEFEQNVNDSVGINNCIRYNFTNGYVTGKYGYGLEFNSTAQEYLTCGNDTSLNFGTGDFSVEVWFKTNNYTSPAIQPFVSKMNISDIGYQLGLSSSEVIFNVGGVSFFGLGGPASSITDNLWHHVVGVVDAENILLYVDGDLIQTEKEDAGSINTIENLTMGFGIWEGTSQYFNGTIDNPRVWNRALSPQEVRNLYVYNVLTRLSPNVAIVVLLIPIIVGVGVLIFLARQLFSEGAIDVKKFIDIIITVLIMIALFSILAPFILGM